MERIYALFYENEDQRHYFYVGRTERDIGVRFKEHTRNAKNEKHTEDVYVFMRNNLFFGEQKQLAIFDEEILCECSDHNPDDYEDFYVVNLVMEGHDLKNMKKGDAKRAAALGIAKERKDAGLSAFSSVQQYVDYRVKRAAQQASKALQDAIRNGQDPTNRAKLLDNWLEQSAERMKEKRAEQAKRTAQKRIRDAAKQAEHDAWLAEKRALFEIDRKS